MKRALTTLAALALAAGTRAEEPEVRAVRATTLDFRPALRVLTSEDVPPGEVVREGDFVLLRIPGAAPEGLALPAVDPPLEGIALERDGARTLIRVKVAPEVPFEASHEPGMLTVVFGELPAPELRGPVTAELYMRLFPAPVQDTEPETPAEGAAGGPEGLRIGRATFRPYVSAAWVDADIFAFSSPVPVRDQYLQIGPGVTASMPVGHGLLSAEYEARLRYFSDIPEVGETSHLAGARLDLPLGSRTQLRLGHRFTRATLETTVVDPGREYFFDLSRFTYNESSALARVDLGARLWAEGEGHWAWNRFDDQQDSALLRLRQPHAAGRPGLRCGERLEGHGELRLRISAPFARPRDRRVDRAQRGRHAGRRGFRPDLGQPNAWDCEARRARSRRARAGPGTASPSAARCAGSSATRASPSSS